MEKKKHWSHIDYPGQSQCREFHESDSKPTDSMNYSYVDDMDVTTTSTTCASSDNVDIEEELKALLLEVLEEEGLRLIEQTVYAKNCKSGLIDSRLIEREGLRIMMHNDVNKSLVAIYGNNITYREFIQKMIKDQLRELKYGYNLLNRTDGD